MTHTLQRVDGELRLQPAKTRTSRRTVPLPKPCVDALKAHKAAQAEERLAAGPKWCDEDMVFSTTIGTPIEPDNLSRSWYKVRTVLGEPAPRFHDMRHTCVSLLLAEGAPPHVVQQITSTRRRRRAYKRCTTWPISFLRRLPPRSSRDRRPQRDRRDDDDLRARLSR